MPPHNAGADEAAQSKGQSRDGKALPKVHVCDSVCLRALTPGNRNIGAVELEEILVSLPPGDSGARERITAGRTLHVVLYEPEIPHNTGAVARLCAATGSDLQLVGRLGFRLDDARVKRAGLDYWPHVNVRRWVDLAELESALPNSRLFALSTKGARLYTECDFQGDSAIVFGSESRGLPPSLVESDCCFRIPMLTDRVRSLNLATAVGIVLFEALRQQGFGGAGEGQ